MTHIWPEMLLKVKLKRVFNNGRGDSTEMHFKAAVVTHNTVGIAKKTCFTVTAVKFDNQKRGKDDTSMRCFLNRFLGDQMLRSFLDRCLGDQMLRSFLDRCLGDQMLRFLDDQMLRFLDDRMLRFLGDQMLRFLSDQMLGSAKIHHQSSDIPIGKVF